MKKRYFKLLLLICPITLIHEAFAQDFDYFAYQPVWRMASMCAQGYPCVASNTYNYVLEGDSVVNSVEYKVLYSRGTSVLMWFDNPPAGCSGSSTFDNVAGLVRIEGKKIFIIPAWESTEQLLYDFDLEVGNTLPLTYNNYQENITVIGIDSINTPYGYLQRFALAGDTWSEYLIEGIGHSKGFIEPINVPLECGYELQCYSLEDEAYYPGPGLPCLIVSSVSEKALHSYGLGLYPNPASTYTMIAADMPLLNGSVRVTDTNGRMILEQNGLSGQKIRIDALLLEPGLYIVQLYESQQFAGAKKLIITR